MPELIRDRFLSAAAFLRRMGRQGPGGGNQQAVAELRSGGRGEEAIDFVFGKRA